MLAEELDTDLLPMTTGLVGRRRPEVLTEELPGPLIDAYQQTVLRLLVWSSLVMLAFAIGVVMGRAGIL